MARRPGLSRARVVDAAAEMIDREGPEALSLAALAQSLGIRTPSLYNHVGGLDDLRGALRLRGLEALEERLGRSAVGLSRGDALRAVAEAYRAFAREHPGLYSLTLRAVGHQPEAARDAAAADAAGARLIGIVLSVLRGYGIEGDDALHATRALRSSLHGFVALEAGGAFGLPLDLDESFERLVAMHDAVLAGSPGGS